MDAPSLKNIEYLTFATYFLASFASYFPVDKVA
jgi:hypothetical protein